MVPPICFAALSAARTEPARCVQGKFITTGLFRYARYPNYFGEMLLWGGLALYSTAHVASAASAAAAACSPVFTFLLLTYGSGVPLQVRRPAT